jgi:hypothetical protein
MPFLACKNSNPEKALPKKSILAYDLRELPKKTTMGLTDLGAIDIQYIPLETVEQSVITSIQKLLFSRDYFLMKNYNDIYMFRYNGTFIKKIGIIGRGPNEYTVAHDVEINPDDGRIYLIDGWQQKFLVYSDSGKFIRTFKYPFRADVDFRFTEDGILCHNNNNSADTEISYVLIDSVGRIIKKFPNKYPWVRNYPTLAFDENVFYRYKRNLFMKEVYSDTVYAFINKNFVPHATILSNDELRISPKARSEEDYMKVGKNHFRSVNLFELNDYIYFEFVCPVNGNTERLTFIASKDSSFTKIIDRNEGFINDLDGGPNFLPRTIKDERTIVSWIDAMVLKTNLNSESFKNSNPKFPDKKIELEKLAQNLKETDNPVLIMVKLKN